MKNLNKWKRQDDGSYILELDDIKIVLELRSDGDRPALYTIAKRDKEKLALRGNFAIEYVVCYEAYSKKRDDLEALKSKIKNMESERGDTEDIKQAKAILKEREVNLPKNAFEECKKFYNAVPDFQVIDN